MLAMGKLRNIAFVDGQNLAQNMRNAPRPWKLDLIKFRTFLKDKYDCDKVYYFIGLEQKSNENLYKFLQHVGYEVVFREHDPKSKGAKKTNVDTDIVFEIMRHVYRDKDCKKVVLVSNDGDYKKTVSCLIDDDKFCAVMFPSSHSSSLYRKIDSKYVVKLYHKYNKSILELKK